MKKIFSAVGISLVMAACNTNPETSVTVTSTEDTTGLAQFRQWKEQQVRDSMAMVNSSSGAAFAPSAAAPLRSRSSVSSTQSTRRNTYSDGNTESTTMNSQSSNTAERRGWSKTAKGAVIGGVVGAGTGAVVNKKNRSKGAIIGGVVGAGTGAVIGHQKDKKDGRH